MQDLGFRKTEYEYKKVPGNDDASSGGGIVFSNRAVCAGHAETAESRLGAHQSAGEVF